MASILIIDDSAFMRTRIREAIDKDGHDVLEAANGLKGLHMALAQRPDCIILDLIMPEMDGFKILQALQEQQSCIPVIVVTADIQLSVKKECLALGAAALINKPPQQRELRNVVREVLSGQKKGPATRQATAEEIDALKELINIGVGRAAGSLNEMLKFRVTLEVPFIKVLTPMQFKSEMKDLGDGNMSAVKISFHGPFSGTGTLVVAPESATKLIGALSGTPGGSRSRDNLEETLREVGNIVVNGVLGSLGNILKQRLSFSLPAYREISIKDLFFSEKIGNDTVFLIVKTKFNIMRIEVEGNIILLFTVGAFDTLLSAIDEMK